MDKPLVNRVANSSLITLNLEDFFPPQRIVHFDMKDYLFMELILKEKDFREALNAHDWSQYEDKTLLVYCSADAIIPVWAYMLVATYAQPFAKTLFQGQAEEFYKNHFLKELDKVDYSVYEGKRIVIKGCGEKDVPVAAYLSLTAKLKPVAKSIMYGEPCSTVPIYKKPRK